MEELALEVEEFLGHVEDIKDVSLLECQFEGMVTLLELIAKIVESLNPVCDYGVTPILQEVQQGSELIMLESDIRKGSDHLKFEGAPSLLLALFLFVD